MSEKCKKEKKVVTVKWYEFQEPHVRFIKAAAVPTILNDTIKVLHFDF